MRFARCLAALAALTSIALLQPALSLADHVTANPQVSARGEDFTETSHIVVVDFAVNCSVSGGQYFGSKYLVDAVTRETIYMGGIASPSGTTRQPVAKRNLVRRMYPLIRASCNSGLPQLHGSPTYEVAGNTVLIPARGDFDRDNRPNRRGGGGAGGQGGRDFPRRSNRFWDPTSPLRGRGSCGTTKRGTNGNDTLNGTQAADVLFGLRGNDNIRGRGDDDCLVGGPGRDRLRGHGGWDRLTGGAGGDSLVGGSGKNRYDAGAGNDVVRAANGQAELVSCGTGRRDRARVDRSDRVGSCERVTRVG